MGESSLDRIANVSRGRGVGPSLAPRMHARLARRDTTSAVGGYCTSSRYWSHRKKRGPLV